MWEGYYRHKFLEIGIAWCLSRMLKWEGSHIGEHLPSPLGRWSGAEHGDVERAHVWSQARVGLIPGADELE